MIKRILLIFSAIIFIALPSRAQISFQQAASANTNVVSITAPVTGDLILVLSYKNGNTSAPTLATGYTSITTKAGTLSAARLGFKVSVRSETDCGTWTGATNIVCLVYRGVNTGALTNVASSTSSGLTISYPTLTLNVTSGTSWVVGTAGDLAALTGMNGTTAALTANRTNQTTVNGLDTNGGVTSFAAQSLVVTGSGSWIAVSLELQQAASTNHAFQVGGFLVGP